MWDKVPPNKLADMGNRENELKSEYWSKLIDAGASINRSDKKAPSAWNIVTRTIEQHDNAEAVQLQRELVDLRYRLSETEAAKALYDSLMKGVDVHKELLVKLEKHARGSNDQQEAARLRDQIEEVNKQMERSFEALKDLKIPFGRRIVLFFTRGI